jgi:hypothetical protein
MPQQFSDWMTLTTSALTAVIAWLVYKVAAHRLWLDMLDRREAALKEVLETSTAYQRTLNRVNDEKAMKDAGYNASEMLAFWIAVDKAAPLFGAEFKPAALELFEAIDHYAELRTQAALARAEGEKPNVEPFSPAYAAIRERYDNLTRGAKPYITVGTRGLSLGQKTFLLRLRLAKWWKRK